MAKFEKGNNAGKKFSGEVATEMQRRSVVSRLANKHGQELVRAMLAQGVQDPVVVEALRRAGYQPSELNNELALHARQIEKAQKTGDTKAYSAVMKAAGYDTLNIRTDVPINITFQDSQAADGLAKALETGAAPRKPKDEE